PGRDAPAEEFYVGAPLRFSVLGGGAVALDGGEREIAIPGVDSEPGKPVHLARDSARAFEFRGADGAVRLALEFDRPVRFLVQDSRRWERDTLDVRFFFAEKTVLRAGEELRLAATVSMPGSGPLALGAKRTWSVANGPEWVEVPEDEAWIEPGSALDFTDVVPHHAPAGAYGRVVAVGEHFEFEDLPGVPQRFYGVNVCNDANFPRDLQTARRFAANMARMGYNAIRLHHHDGGWKNGGADARDRFDALVAACIENGIYVTTDLHVSRPVPWRDVGIDRDGCMGQDDFKLLCAFWEPAYSNLCDHARAFLRHENPYTGRCLAEEPALAGLALVNEGNLGNWGAAALRALPGVPPLPDNLYAQEAAIVLADADTRLFRRLAAFVRDECGCRAPLSNDSSWYEPAQYALQRRDFGYVDNHFYVAHPSFLDEPWRRPSRAAGGNPFASADLGVPGVVFRRLAGKPFTISEYNWCAPSPWRSAGGLATGALAARQGWTSVYRFAWSHSAEGIEHPGTGTLGYFKVAGDPVALAAERAATCLFLRGDMDEAAARDFVALSEERLRSKDFGAPKLDTLGKPAKAWESKVGVEFEETGGAGGAGEAGESGGGCRIAVDREAGSLAIDTPRTSGGFAERGSLDCGALRFEILPAAGQGGGDSAAGLGCGAAVWASSLDGAPLRESARVLLVHLPDVQNSGAVFADPAHVTML
ncbi:MAG: cellulase family glycosylhydrolase, partial [Kiritimatiellae bacterium]|nr:cellulase family glycosylhydrolase [Kiritimatiellia bacterium]